MSVLVTGGAGFIGQHLIGFLNQKGFENVVVVDKDLSNLKRDKSSTNLYLQFDLNDSEKLDSVIKNHHIEFVFHLAANSDIRNGTLNAKPDFDDTLNTTLVISELLKFNNIKKIFFASSSAIFGQRLNPICKADNLPKIPISYYGKSKLASEFVLESKCRELNIDLQILRFPNVIGPDMTHGLIFDLANKIKSNPDRLEVLGDGNQNKPFMYVTDLVEIIYILWTSQSSVVENVSPIDNISVREIVDLTCRFFNIRPEIVYGESSAGWVGDVPYYSYQDFDNPLIEKNLIRTSKNAVIDTLTSIVNRNDL
jgi:UDP-glucose 4-epimerase